MRTLFFLVAGASFMGCGAPPPGPAAGPASGPTSGPASGAPVVAPGESPDEQGGPGASAPSAQVQAPMPPTPAPDAREAATAPLCDDGRNHRPCVARFQGRCWLHGACTTPPCSPPVEVTCRDDLPLPAEVCGRVEACVGVSDEGCCVGCDNPFLSRIATSCAPRIETARDCAAVAAVARSPGCVK